MSIAIDWSFIEAREGMQLTGYVPNPKTSQSGVTIASGIDLSAHTEASLSTLSADLLAKLRPYLGLKTAAAIDALRETPLSVTQEEAEELDELVRGQAVKVLADAYDAASEVRFEDIGPRPQTVLASVAFQYGNLAKKCPKFWAHAIVQDWAGVKFELEHFGDDYTSRRMLEAKYLAPVVVMPVPDDA